MIRYHKLSYFEQLCAIRGGVLSLIAQNSFYYLVFLIGLYWLCLQADSDVIIEGDPHAFHMIGKFVTFLLVFRLNQCWNRYCHAMDLTAMYYVHLNNILSMCLAYMRGANQGALHLLDPEAATSKKHWKNKEQHLLYEGLAITSKVHIARLTVAAGLALKYHCRVTECNITDGRSLDPDEVTNVLFDYIRMKGLLYPQEHPVLSGACGLYNKRLVSPPGCCTEARVQFQWHANLNHTPVPADQRGVPHRSSGSSPDDAESDPRAQPVFQDAPQGMEQEPDYLGVPLPLVMLQLLRGYVRQPLKEEWGYVERIVNLSEIHFASAAHAFEQLDRLITSPLPLAYVQHCKILFLVFSFLYPLVLPTSDGIWANIALPFSIFVSLYGFECLAEHFENPLGDDISDLNVIEMIHELEVRTHEVFEMAGRHRAKLREASIEPIRDVNLCKSECSQYSTKSREALDLIKPVEKGELFFHHFAWVPMPPHVFMHCLAMDNLFSAWRLRRIQQSAVAYVTGQEGRQKIRASGKNTESALIIAFQEQCEKDGYSHSSLTHFLCLKDMEEPVIRQAINVLAEDYLSLHGNPLSLIKYAKQSSDDRMQLISDLGTQEDMPEDRVMRIASVVARKASTVFDPDRAGSPSGASPPERLSSSSSAG